MSVKSWPGGKGEMTSMTNKVKIMLWVCVVYILSSICYIPMMLQQHGISVPNGLSLLKYLFVCIPATSAFLFLSFEHRLKKYFATAFSGKIALKQIGIWAIMVFAGVSVSLCYSFAARTELFQNTYPSVMVLLASCMYLFATAFIEELAWRGFLLEQVSFRGESICSIILVGIIWTIWHLPMWIVRNSLGAGQIIPLSIRTLLESVVLGISYYQCRKIMFIAILHTTFNICYLSPIAFNIAALALVLIAVALLWRQKWR